jgi:Abnormal spindle-like microcephaly-assoc'd, ASPM-SPD-2-Hydin
MFGDSRPVRTIILLAASLSIIAITGCGTTGAFPSGSSGGTGSGSSSAVLALSPTSVSFGSVVVGSSSSRSIAISNTGNAALTLSQVNVSGSGYSDSGLTLPMTLAAGTSASFILTFTPPATGTDNGSVSFVSNASNSPMSMSLTGTGAAAAVAQLTPNPSNVNFGNVTVGSSSTQSISISNSGNVSVTISQITASGTGFSVSGVSVPLTLNPGQSSTYTVQFAPTTTGTDSGQISFVSNATNSPNVVTLSGSAVAAPVPQLSVSATSLSFGNVNVGSSTTKTVAISNSGNANLSISQIAVSGAGFTGSGITVPLTLTPGQSANYTVQFAPASASSASGQVSFTSNAATNPTVSLSGTGVTPPAPVLSVSPASLSFGNLVVGSSSTKSITITNSGGANLSISQITTSGTGFSGSGVTLPLILTPGQTATYTVTFSPASSGSASGQVSFTSNASTNPTVSLGGTGVTTTLTASPTSLSFGNVTVGNSATLSEKLTASNGSVTISAVIPSGTGYSISGLTLPLTLSAGQSKTFSVVFAPAATGSSSGSLTITSDANTGPSAVSLSGTGVTQTSGPICGLLNDGLVHLPTNYDTFTPPGVGQSYVDPVYGCTVTRLTNGGAETFGDGTHPGLMNYYSTFTALNATDNLVLVIATDGNWSIRSTTGSIVVPSSNIPSWSGHPVWDATNGNVLYYPMGNSVYRGTISGSSVTQTLLHTFNEYSGVSSPDAADLSQDGDHMILVGQNSNGTMDIFTWSFSQNSKTYVYTTSCTGGCLHKLQFSPDNRLTIQFNGDGTGTEQGVRLWTGSRLVHIEDNTNHYDTGYDLNGVPIIVARGNSLTLSGETNPCPSGWGMDVRQLDNVNAAVCLLDNVGSWHVSYRGDASQPWIAISFFDTNSPGPEFFSSDSNYRTISTSNWQLYEDEIILAKVDGSKVYRLAHARSRSMESYWAQPHAAISRDGKYVVFSSDMAHPNGCPANMHVANDCSDVYMIQIQ